jgi:hypothetical protein
VAGLCCISGLRFTGRTGATDNPPVPTEMVDSGRCRTAGAAEAEETADEFETLRLGEKCDIAEPGRVGKVRVAAKASFFFASIVSRSDGLPGPRVLFDKPIPGRTAVSVFFGELGLLGSFCNSFCAVASRLSIILRTCHGELAVNSRAANVAEMANLHFSSCRPNPSKYPVCGSHSLPHTRVRVI